MIAPQGTPAGGAIHTLLKWKTNKRAHLSLCPFLPPPLSQPSPLLSPHQWRPPLHDASLLRGFLCSLVSQVNTRMGHRREGGEGVGFLFEPISPFTFFHHLQSPDPASTAGVNAGTWKGGKALCKVSFAFYTFLCFLSKWWNLWVPFYFNIGILNRFIDSLTI